EAWRALLPRFNFVVDKFAFDEQDKEYLYEAIVSAGPPVLDPLREYLRTAPTLTYPIKMLKAIVSSQELVSDLLEMLSKFDTGYEKNPERKIRFLSGLERDPDPGVTPAVLPFLEDFNEDVRFHAVRALVAQGDEAARLPLLTVLLGDSSVRLRTTIIDGL